jgi:hypothetical protein
MRTTVTLEPDVAAALARLERAHGLSQKEVINTAIREFVQRRALRPAPRVYRTPSVDVGRCLLGSIDDVADAIAIAEGDDHR